MSYYQNMSSSFASAGDQTRKGFAKLANGGFSTFVKIVMIIVTVYVVCISATNIAAYAYILKKPDDQQNVTKTWCIALIALNVVLMLMAFAILTIVIVSFFRKGGQKVAEVVQASNHEGMLKGIQQGIKIAAMAEAAHVKNTADDKDEGQALAKVTLERIEAESIRMLRNYTSQNNQQNMGMMNQTYPTNMYQGYPMQM